VPSTSLPAAAQRNISNPFRSKDKTSTDKDDLTNPLLEKYLKQTAIEEGSLEERKDKKRVQPTLRTGTMNDDPSSLFAPEREVPGWDPALPPQKQAELKVQAERQRAAAKAEEDKKLSSVNLDPDPQARRRLERKLVIKGVKRHGRLTKAENIARTERQSLYKSQALPTSTKKLQKVVNQIAGKTVSEALVQLRFSKKRIARDVIKGLQIAENEAIAARGMGLEGGKSKAEIELKDGSKKVVRDPSKIYIDQAWVGKGETWKSPEYRARGMVNLLRHRTTSESLENVASDVC
jgi:ribosomal protein L22